MNEIVKVDKETGELYVAKEVIDVIRNLELDKKRIDKEYKEYKNALKSAMEEYGIEKIDSDELLVTYIDGHERISVDTKRLEEQYPKVYMDCLKASDVKPSVRVTVREPK